MFWDLPEISLLGTIRVFCSNAESRFGCASSRRLRLVLWLFTSCVCDVLRNPILIKTAFVSWANQKFSKTTLSPIQKCLFELCSAGFFGCKKKLFWELAEISLHEIIRVFCSNSELRFGCAISRTLRLVLWLFTSCVWDVLRHRILIKQLLIFSGNVVFVVSFCVQLIWWCSSKPSEKFWAISPKRKHKLSKTTFTTFQKCLFELSFAFLFGCNYKKCFETFLRSLYLEQYVFFVQMQSHVSAAPVLEGYDWYFGSLHPAFEMSCDIEYL